MSAINEKIFFFFNSFAGVNTLIDSLIVFIANDIPFLLIGFTFIYFIFLKRNPKQLFVVTILTLSSALVTEFLKWIVFRHPRPFIALEGVTQLIEINSMGSFPSQHATIFSALAVSVFIYDKKVGVWFFVLAFLIGVSRIISGIHFPLDILTGFFIGFVVTYGIYKIYRKFVIFLEDYFS